MDMNLHRIALLCLSVFPLGYAASGKQPTISYEEAYAELQPAKPEGSGINPSGINGRILTGYQGWFRAEGDGSGLGFTHYVDHGPFKPGNCSIDLWPDLSEFDADELFPTPFQHRNGATAKVFSSVHPKTVNRHFSWMEKYGIDGAFVQRFGIHGATPRTDYRSLKFENRKLKLCRDAAIKHKRCWALMYDLTGLHDLDFERLAADWKSLRQRMRLGDDPNDTAYLQFNGKPLVAIWGVGFGDDRDYGLEKSAWFIRLLKDNPEWGGMSIMLGVPYYWRTQTRDATESGALISLIEMADVVSPWSVGRYRNTPDEMAALVEHQRADRTWCGQRKIEYLPVLWPGFSWQNMTDADARNTTIPRDDGQFLWQQFRGTMSAGNSAAYVAMFDEIDEGTAIFKCTNDPPTGRSHFQTFGDNPSDYYMWLVGEGGRLLRGELPKRYSSH